MVIRFFLGLMMLLNLVYGNDSHTISTQRAGQLREFLVPAINNCLKDRMYQNVDVGIQIESMDGKHILYRRHVEALYVPASAVKIFTSAISLIKFGPGYQFETPLKTDGSVVNHILEGNLYLEGRGDPSLMNRHLKGAAKQLKVSGINRIEGDVVYDISFLDKPLPRYPPNARHFYAPVGAITVNFNWLETKLEEGPPPKLRTVPQTGYARLNYKIRISRSHRPGRPKMTYQEMPWGDYYTIRGTVTGWDRKYKYLQLLVTRPGLFGATLLKEDCQKAGIKITGSIRKGKAPPNARVLYTIKTPKLIEVIRTLNRESNNVVAELLNKDLGAYFNSVPGTGDKGLAIMRNFCIEVLGFKKSGFTIDDASGLSPENRFSAAQFTHALNYFYKRLGNTFVETLAPQGHHPHAVNPVPPEGMRLFVKSGTLSVRGVNTVVGYIFLDRTGEVFSFALLCNRRGKGGMAYSGTFTNPILTAIIKTFNRAN
jgi:D-alanyl-D-alanine carboxypeptidase/D-alanyl-D-alanine-endopeptidase (penicillin-binding protein 4)